MPEDILIEVVVADEVFGSGAYTVSVRLTNTSQNPIDKVIVDPLSVMGKPLFDQRDIDETPVSEIEALRRRLLEEMERQLGIAYERNRMRNLPFFDRAVYAYARLLGVPSHRHWAREAMRIQEFSDIDRLENDIMATEKEESFLRKAFNINKDKLARCLAKIDAAEPSESSATLNAGPILPPGASLSHPFRVQAPHLLRARQFDLEFTVSYHFPKSDQVVQRFVSHRVTVRPSPFAVPLGGMIGAALGFVIRATVAGPNSTNSPPTTLLALGGSIVLGLVFALLTARKPDKKQAIAVEDFVGGVIIGALAGLFSQQVLDKLANLLK